MEGRISMSEKELYRLQILKEVEEKKMSAFSRASNSLKINNLNFTLQLNVDFMQETVIFRLYLA